MNAAIERASVAAEALEQTLLRSAEAMESIQSLAQTRHDLVRAGDAAGATAIADYLAGIAKKEKFGVLQVATIAPDGWMTWSTTGVQERVWLGDREHFLVHLNGEKGMNISKPLIGRASRRWSVQFTRPLVDKDGRFDGVVVVSFDPLKLSETLASLRFGEQDVSAVLSVPQGYLIASSQDADQQLDGAPTPNAPVLLAAQKTPIGTLHSPSTVSGRPLIMSYRAVGQLPLVVVVGLDEENELAEADSVATWVRLSTIATLLLAAALLAVLALRAARQRSRMELELTRQEADAAEMARTHIARLLSGLPAAVYGATLTPDGTVDRFEITETAQRLTGWDLDELATRNGWTGKVQGLDADAWTTYFRKVLRDGEASIEYSFLRRDGATVWFRDQARVVERRGGGEIAVVGYVSDITRERSMQEQAFAASKLATLGEMATGLAHELNQPIAIMSLAAENASQVLERKGAEGIKFATQRMTRIAEQAGRARTIINHLRIFGRQNNEELGPISLSEVVTAACALSTPALSSAGVTVGVEMAGEVPPAMGQLVLAEQVVVNLLINARDAMEGNPERRPRHVRISTSHDDAAHTVSLSIHDSGPGIPASVLERIFEPFFTTKQVGKGTGLGLSLCHGIMRSFGGAITACNAPDGGAVFTVIFRQTSADAISS